MNQWYNTAKSNDVYIPAIVSDISANVIEGAITNKGLGFYRYNCTIINTIHKCM